MRDKNMSAWHLHTTCVEASVTSGFFHGSFMISIVRSSTHRGRGHHGSPQSSSTLHLSFLGLGNLHLQHVARRFPPGQSLSLHSRSRNCCRAELPIPQTIESWIRRLIPIMHPRPLPTFSPFREASVHSSDHAAFGNRGLSVGPPRATECVFFRFLVSDTPSPPPS